MTAGLITAAIGLIVWVCPAIQINGRELNELGKYAFAVGLLAWLFGH